MNNKYNKEDISESFWKDGYVHLKRVFNPSELKILRKKVLTLNSSKNTYKQGKRDLLLNKEISKFLLDERLLEIVNIILGDIPIYFGDSSFTVYDTHERVGKYHKDCTDRLDPKAPDWQGEYPLLRVGFLLQNHKKQSGGILLGKESHNILFSNKTLRILHEEVFGWIFGKFKHIESDIGDLVIWNLRTTHAPMGKYFKFFFKMPISERLSRIIPRFLQNTYKGKRCLVQITFALKSNHLDRYINYLKTRDYQINKWKNSKYTKTNIKIFASKKVKFLNMNKTITNEISKGFIKSEKKWKPFDYKQT